MNAYILAALLAGGYLLVHRYRRNPDDDYNPNIVVEEAFQRLMELCEEGPSKERTQETRQLNQLLAKVKPDCDPDIYREFERQYRAVKRMNS